MIGIAAMGAGLLAKWPLLGSKLLWMTVLVGGAMVIGFTSGLKVSGWRHDSQALAAEQAAHAAYQAGMQRSLKTAGEITTMLYQARVQLDTDRRAWRGRLNAVDERLGECVAARLDEGRLDHPEGAGPVSVARLSADGVRLWNEALRVGLPAGGDPAGADGADPGPGAPATLKAALENLEDNSATCNALRERLRAWQRLALKHSWVTHGE